MASILLALPILLVVAAIAAIFLSIGASVAGIEGRSYGKAFIATGANFFASWILSAVLGFVGFNNGFIPFAFGVALSFFIIKTVFATSWPKAAGAWIVQVIATVLIIGVPLFFIFGLAMLKNL